MSDKSKKKKKKTDEANTNKIIYLINSREKISEETIKKIMDDEGLKNTPPGVYVISESSDNNNISQYQYKEAEVKCNPQKEKKAVLEKITTILQELNRLNENCFEFSPIDCKYQANNLVDRMFKDIEIILDQCHCPVSQALTVFTKQNTLNFEEKIDEIKDLLDIIEELEYLITHLKL